MEVLYALESTSYPWGTNLFASEITKIASRYGFASGVSRPLGMLHRCGKHVSGICLFSLIRGLSWLFCLWTTNICDKLLKLFVFTEVLFSYWFTLKFWIWVRIFVQVVRTYSSQARVCMSTWRANHTSLDVRALSLFSNHRKNLFAARCSLRVLASN